MSDIGRCEGCMKRRRLFAGLCSECEADEDAIAQADSSTSTPEDTAMTDKDPEWSEVPKAAWDETGQPIYVYGYGTDSGRYVLSAVAECGDVYIQRKLFLAMRKERDAAQRELAEAREMLKQSVCPLCDNKGSVGYKMPCGWCDRRAALSGEKDDV